MKISRADFGYIIVLDSGESIDGSFFEFAKKHNPPSSFIFGMGSLSEVKIGFYDSLTDEFIEKSVNDCLEMTSFIGNLTYQHDIPILHAHITAVDKNFNTIGGHFISGKINITGEFYVITEKLKIHRAFPEGRTIPLIDGFDTTLK